MTERWIRVTTCDAIPEREGRVVVLPRLELAIFNLGDRFAAVENRCPHQHGPLADGIVSGCAVVCPLHGWKVSLETGAVERPKDAAHCVRTFPTRVDGDVVLVRIDAAALARADSGRAA